MANKAVFLDRDDTLIEDLGYISDPDQVKLLDGVGESLSKLRQMGYKLIVVSNQSAVARGIVSEEVLGAIHERLEELLAHDGVKIDKIYYCPFHPDGSIPKYRKESDWRKPKPGMLLAAAEELDIDLGASWLVGNSQRDIHAGLTAGCKTILIDDAKHSVKTEPGQVEPDYKAVNMKEVINVIRKHDRNTEAMEPELKQKQDTNHKQTTLTSDLPPAQEFEEGTLPEWLGEESSTEQLLREILEQLKKNRRQEMFSEFSVMRLMAGIVQTVVLFCLVIAVWLLMSPTRQVESVLISLGFAVVFQIMALTFFRMHSQK
jgi:D,D-heptose 1,7-bisphosphate phosphatase